MIRRGSAVSRIVFGLLLQLAYLLTPAPLRRSIRVTSYVRDDAAPDSQHKPDVATAIDLGIRPGAERLAADAFAAAWRSVGGIAVFEPDAPGGPHWHLQLFRAGRETL